MMNVAFNFNNRANPSRRSSQSNKNKMIEKKMTGEKTTALILV